MIQSCCFDFIPYLCVFVCINILIAFGLMGILLISLICYSGMENPYRYIQYTYLRCIYYWFTIIEEIQFFIHKNETTTFNNYFCISLNWKTCAICIYGKRCSSVFRKFLRSKHWRLRKSKRKTCKKKSFFFDIKLSSGFLYFFIPEYIAAAASCVVLWIWKYIWTKKKTKLNFWMRAKLRKEIK